MPSIFFWQLAQNADVNKADCKAMAPLIWAAIHNGITTSSIIPALLRHGADVNASSRGGKTALCLLSYSRHDSDAETVGDLIRWGANVNWRDKEGWDGTLPSLLMTARAWSTTHSTLTALVMTEMH
ncbi:hypothetical protein GGTG_12424, partial [Gaeumannomyces tritici R3-111a-1]